MQFFLHSDTRIRIVNGELEFECTDESKFDVVKFGGQLYQVRLVAPVQFVAYRNL